ncbi:alpha/beta hydrolase [Demequina sp. SYSU T00192]|uniref:Alpha/beta hydrolase n=1 Tax=Demequina litoralis TaxID=3051660 RepID=A0ABT8G5C3_9MICO|nr:alpha/beta hydrolase [Demequina sp. SYSU T00192]MDN4474329.1 alpha/beta hydrolase [Demequina sp. SYSU T00192]
MSGPGYRRVAVPVDGGDLAVGVWEPAGETKGTALLVHGVTSSHLAFTHLARRLPGLRLIAPDLRGRGGSHAVRGPAGMEAHARDLVAVLDAFGLESVPVVGHSMGAFVAVVLAHRAPDRVTGLVLIDGGLPLAAPAGLSAEDTVAAILGPTAARLSMRFRDVDAYLDFWHEHPAFAGRWTRELEAYFAYDLVPGDGGLRPATSYATTVDDTIDLTTGDALREALASLDTPTLMLTAPRGLLDEEPGLYEESRLATMLAGLPAVRHQRVEGVNHYTLVMSPEGADAVAPAVAGVLAGERSTA